MGELAKLQYFSGIKLAVFQMLIFRLLSLKLGCERDESWAKFSILDLKIEHGTTPKFCHALKIFTLQNAQTPRHTLW